MQQEKDLHDPSPLPPPTLTSSSTNDSSSLPPEASKEGLLFDVLAELDKERERRAELEQKLRMLNKESRRESDASSELSKMLKDLGAVDEEIDAGVCEEEEEVTINFEGSKKDGADSNDGDNNNNKNLLAKIESLNTLVSSLTASNEALLINRQEEAKNKSRGKGKVVPLLPSR